MANGRSIHINLVEGDRAPRYDTGYEVQVSHVTITEKGMQSGLLSSRPRS